MYTSQEYFEAHEKFLGLEYRQRQLRQQLHEIETRLYEARITEAKILAQAMKEHVMNQVMNEVRNKGKVLVTELKPIYRSTTKLSRQTFMSYIEELERDGRVQTRLEEIYGLKRLVIYPLEFEISSFRELHI